MECFSSNLTEIEDRIDPHFYRPEFERLLSLLKKLNSVPLDEIVEFSSETWNQNDFFNDKFPYIEISEVDITTGEIKNVASLDKKEAPSRAKMIVKKDDIIVSTTRPHRGAISYIDSSKEGFIASTGFAILRGLKETNIIREYIFFYLRSKPSLLQMLQRSSGGNYPAITSEELKKILVPVPNIEKQHLIVKIMQSAYDKKKQKEKEAEELLNSIDDYVLGELGIEMPEMMDKKCYVMDSNEIEARLDPYYYQPMFKQLGKAVMNGKYMPEKLGDFITKMHYGVSIKNIYVEKGIPLLRICNIQPNKIDLSEVVNLDESTRKEIGSGFVNEGDILISRSGSVGISAVVPKEAEGFAFGSFMIKFCVNESINKEYVSIWLNNKISTLFTEREKIGAIQGNITISTIEGYKIPLPPLPTQEKIAQEVKQRMSKAEDVKNEAIVAIEQAKKEVESIILDKENG